MDEGMLVLSCRGTPLEVGFTGGSFARFKQTVRHAKPDIRDDELWPLFEQLPCLYQEKALHECREAAERVWRDES